MMDTILMMNRVFEMIELTVRCLNGYELEVDACNCGNVVRGQKVVGVHNPPGRRYCASSVGSGVGGKR